MLPNLGMTTAHLEKSAHLLNSILADEMVLYVKTRNAHWNVEGPDFHDKHKFFESQYEQLDDHLDDVAERIRVLGHYAPAKLNDYLRLTHLTEVNNEGNSAKGFVRILLADHESIISKLRQLIEPMANEMRDFGTSDFITGLMESHEKMAWMLRAQIK